MDNLLQKILVLNISRVIPDLETPSPDSSADAVPGGRLKPFAKDED